MAARLFPIYNVDSAVGPRQANRADDVRLVQAIFIELARFGGTTWMLALPANQRTLTTTGLFDKRLEKWTVAFQKWATSEFGAKLTEENGVIEPVPIPTILLGTAFQGTCTLSIMCDHLWRFDPEAYLKIGMSHELPWYPSAWDPERIYVS